MAINGLREPSDLFSRTRVRVSGSRDNACGLGCVMITGKKWQTCDCTRSTAECLASAATTTTSWGQGHATYASINGETSKLVTGQANRFSPQPTEVIIKATNERSIPTAGSAEEERSRFPVPTNLNFDHRYLTPEPTQAVVKATMEWPVPSDAISWVERSRFPDIVITPASAAGDHRFSSPEPTPVIIKPPAEHAIPSELVAETMRARFPLPTEPASLHPEADCSRAYVSPEPTSQLVQSMVQTTEKQKKRWASKLTIPLDIATRNQFPEVDIE